MYVLNLEQDIRYGNGDLTVRLLFTVAYIFQVSESE